MNKARCIYLLILLGLLSGCEHFAKQQAGVGKAITFDDLPGWHQDQHNEALIALRKSCPKMLKKPNWATICQTANTVNPAEQTQAKKFFEAHFTPHVLIGDKGKCEGLITGYYEPLLHGALRADERYRYPLYRPPDDMLIVELAALYPELEGKRVRGRLVGNKVLPYYARAEIEDGQQRLQGQELLWVDNRDELFFLQIQGSGRIKLPDGRIIGAGYANQNGHAYISIGKKLIEMGELKREDVSLFSIKDWLENNPSRAQSLLNQNPSYVFFTLKENLEDGPRGSLNVPLTAERSLAIDPKFIELGSPIWLSTTYPDNNSHKLQKLMIAQDTGGAIKGQLRADVFWGTGEHAETMAGNMKQTGKLFVLRPKL